MNNTETMIDDKLIRLQLKRIRKSSGITQKQLSEKSGLSESCISNIESGGDVSPSLRSLIKYAHAVGAELRVDISDWKETE